MKKVKGSVMIWALSVISIVAILATAGFAITNSMINISVDNNSKKQLLLTSQSAVDVITTSISENTDGLADYVKESTDDIITSDFFGSLKNMSGCTVTVRISDDKTKIYIQAETVYGSYSEISSAIMVKRNSKYIVGRYSDLNIDKLVAEENT